MRSRHGLMESKDASKWDRRKGWFTCLGEDGVNGIVDEGTSASGEIVSSEFLS